MWETASGLEKIYINGVLDKELQESMDQCTGHCDVSEIWLKTALNTIQSVNLYSLRGIFYFIFNNMFSFQMSMCYSFALNHCNSSPYFSISKISGAAPSVYWVGQFCL